ncbi:MAG: hypothetical protein ABIS86_16765 [Streptosporangiaceae bacterium]
MDTLDLAASAQDLSEQAPDGSLDRAAAGSVAVTCATARDVFQARAALERIQPYEVRAAALELFDRLSEQS